MKSVYCYFLPEVRQILHRVERALPDDMWLVTTPAQKIEEALEKEGLFSVPLKIPANKDGSVCIDEIHVPIIDRIVDAYRYCLPDLGGFGFRYPTGGSSEGIFHLLAKYRTQGVESINVLFGEYEGYSEYSRHLGMRVECHDLEKEDPDKIKPGVWFISNPSARDGNIIPNESIKELCNAGHKVVLDFAYVGATQLYRHDSNHPNIDAVVMSFSKPYGVFRFRIGGLAFTRTETPSLFGNKWFKDTTRLIQALKLAEDIGPTNIHSRYSPMQSEIIKELNLNHGIGIMHSDSFLLGYLKEAYTQGFSEEKLQKIAPFKRGPFYRFCLTPYFEMREKGEL